MHEYMKISILLCCDWFFLGGFLLVNASGISDLIKILAYEQNKEK